MVALHIHTTVLPDGVARDLWIEDGRFVEGPLDTDAAHVGGFAVSGLVDAHAHLALNSPIPEGDAVARATASARAHVQAGVLAVREPGSPEHASAALDGMPGLPTIHTAGRFLAPPERYLPGLARYVDDEALPGAALEELAHSGRWVKIIGDFFDDEGRFTPNYGIETLSHTAALVHEAGGRITMHAMIPESVQQAIDAGFDAIEHGSLIEPTQVAAMAAAGMTWTPTAIIDDILRATAGEMVGPDGLAFLVDGMATRGEAIRMANELGVRILAGTDAGMTPHGVVAQEILLLEAFGLPTAAALGAGSWDAREYLGLPGVEIGAPADLVVFPDDPREDLGLLAHPQLVVLRGEIVSGI